MTARHPRREGPHEAGDSPLRQKLFVIIFKADTPAGRLFDVLLILTIVTSVGVVLLASVRSIGAEYGTVFRRAEWLFTILFTVEYLVRLYCVKRPLVYARSFFGVVDLLSAIPLYLELMITGAGHLLVIRILRILRVFRVLKLTRYVGEANVMLDALRASRRKIAVFLYTLLTIVVIFGTLIYLIEGEESGFTSIPKAMYWAIVTMTTVGYGDLAPQTPLGQAMSALLMITGYGIIAVPTGIYASELTQLVMRRRRRRPCAGCGLREHADDAAYCRACGTALAPLTGPAED